MSAVEQQVAVVIVLHNSAATLRDCLDALLGQAALAEVILVDNASTDDWRDQLPDDPRIRQVLNPDNAGFSAACNQGAAATQSPWLLFLNPDCLLPAGALVELLEVADARGGQGLLGAQLLEADGRLQPASRRLAPTPPRLLRGRIDLPAPPWSKDPGKAPVFEALEAISGALMLIPRSLFDALGGFDEGYRLHCEDLDLCRRVHQHHAWVGIAPRVRVVHIKGTSSRRRPLWVEWQKHRGIWRYFRKFDAAQTPWWLNGVLWVGLWCRLPLAAIRGLYRARVEPTDAIEEASPHPGDR